MRRLLMVLVIVLGALALVGCSDNDNKGNEDTGNKDAGTENANNNNEEEEEQEVRKLKVAYMPNFASLNLVVAGMETGAFEEQNIEIELVEFADGPTIIAAMESGSIDVGYIGPGAHVLSIQGSADIFSFSQLGNADEVIGNTEKGVNSIEDLKGKVIAVASGTSSETILNMTLQEAGIEKDEVELMYMDASAIVTAMISGSVDAAATWAPNTIAIKNEMGDEALMLSNNVRYADEFPSIASWIVNPEYGEENHDLLVDFTKALYVGMDYRVDNLEEVAEWVAKAAALNPELMKEEIDVAEWITSGELMDLIESGELEEYYESQQANFVQEERLTEDELVDVSDYVLFDIMNEAAE